MKNVLIKILTAVKTYKGLVVVLFVVLAIAIIVEIHVAINDDTIQLPPSQVVETAEDVVSSKEALDETVLSAPISDGIVSQEETASKPLPSKNESSNPTTSSSSSGLSWNPPEDNIVLHPTSGLPFIQPTNTDTGLSWDGASPIIYTYPDGTTGTEKQEGATYEYVPGVIYTVEKEITPIEYDGTCNKCGRIEGDGTNGTCARYLMGDVDCPYCGVHVTVRTCHTCGK